MKKASNTSVTKRLVEKHLLIPFVAITSLFALWGIANDMTNPLVSAFKKVMPELSNAQAAFVQLAFYGGYATMAIPAALFIRRFSYKKGVLVGLLLYAIGALMFLPAAKYQAYGFFLASLYILTFGLAFLETTANPFILSLGNPETATRRLNLAQTFNPMGSLIGMLTAQVFIIKLLQSDDYTADSYRLLPEAQKALIRSNDLDIISAPYIGLGLFIVVMLLIIKFIRIPEEQRSFTGKSPLDTFRLLMKNKRYYEGVIAQAFYVGAQIMCWTFIYQYVEHLNASRPANEQLTATWYNMGAMIFFLSGRALSTYLMKFIRPVKLMLVFSCLAMALLAGVMLSHGIAGLYCLVAVSICMSLMFPTIYGIALAGMGEEAKLASAGLVMAIGGGGLLPPLQGKILDIGGYGLNDVQLFGYIPEINFSFILPFISFIVIAVYSYRSLRYLKNPFPHRIDQDEATLNQINR